MSNKLLIIGCGGTGTKICNEMIKTLGPNMPSDRVAIVVLDAHERGYEPGSLDAGRSNVITMSSYTPISQGLQRCVDRLERNNPGCVGDWFPKNMQFPQEAMYSDGCGAYRPYGKFFSYYFHDTIKATIQNGYNRLTSSNFLSMNQRAQQARIDVIICASLGNGTGGGTFMDVAAIVNDIITKQAETEPRVYGFFIPSSVTYKGPKNMKGYNNLQPFQIAASGYAALVELQSEFSRKDAQGSNKIKPNAPFSARFYSRESDGYDHEIFFDDINKSPFDGVYIFDKRDDYGYSHSYPTIIKTAGQSLASIIGGEADPEGRLLDIVLRFQEQCFSSMGVARLCVPTEKLTEALVCKISSKVIGDVCERTSLDLSKWGHLLELTIAEEQFPPPDPEEDITISDYIEAFIGKFLRIQEASRDGDGTQHNQLFDVFTDLEAKVRQTLKKAGSNVSLSDATGAQVGTKANAMYAALGNILSEIPTKWKFILEESKWSALPKSTNFETLETLDGVGAKYLIDGMVQRLVNENAFGLLEAWLDELWAQIKKNKDSVELQDLRNSPHGSTSSIENIDITQNDHVKIAQQKKGELLEKSSNTMNRLIGGFLGGDSVEDIADEFENSCKKAVDFVIWGVKLQAVSDLYDKVLSHVDRWRSIIRKLNNYLTSQTVLGHINDIYEDVSEDLSLGTGSGTGSLTEFLSCSRPAQDHLINELLQNEKLKSEEILSGGEINQTIWQLLYSKIDAQERKHFNDVFGPNLGGDAQMRFVAKNRRNILKSFPEELTSVLRNKLRPFVGPLCKVDNLLKEDSEALIIAYYDNVFNENADMAVRERKAIRDDLLRVVQAETIEQLDVILKRSSSEQKRADKLVEATDLIFQARILQLANAALSKVDLKVSKRDHIIGSVGIIFDSECREIKRIEGSLSAAISGLNNNMSGSLVPLNDFSSDEILAIGSVHGMTLNDLNMFEIHKHYVDSMKDKDARDSRARKNYAPHTTQQYMELGQKYLAKGDDTTREDFTAEGILALAYMKQEAFPEKFSWLTFEGKNFKVNRKFPTNYKDGSPVPSCIASKNSATGRELFLEPIGFEDVIYWLEGRDATFADGADWLKGLKKLLWDEIRLLLFGDPNDFLSEGVDVSELVDAINNEINKLTKLSKKSRRIKDGVEAMIDGLKAFLNDIKRTPLSEDVVPRFFR